MYKQTTFKKFCVAIMDGDISEVQRLMLLINPKDNNSVALSLAAEYGHAQLVALLLTVCEPNSHFLLLAAQRGHTECVELLIPHCNTHDFNSVALQDAARRQHWECVNLLYPHSDVRAAIDALHKDHSFDYDKWWPLEERWEQEKQHVALNQAVENFTNTSHTTKKKI